ncbi:MerC domain-containing protein [Seonamhaeicola sp.]|uniref:MerC domain-containing protein n=1 Tax=Seonamhaeicola sp. TaxID=1912245 RepID=UPI0026038BE4|nr:MerC domain-containing protein [Seonamhaeicola sp.]
MKLLLQKSDTLGAFSSALCLVHCLVTPILFIAQASSVCCSASVPTWWKSIDYLFLIISFFAVYRSTQTTSKDFMKPALWICWIILFFAIINEHLQVIHLPEIFTYVPALGLVALHLYNLKYCQCNKGPCCTN